MTKSTITRERLEQLADNNTICKVSWDERIELAQIALAAMDSSESVELPLDYLQGHKDGLEWAARLAEANHPETGDWLYDDPIELAKAIRKGPDMPPAQPVPVFPGWIPVSERMPEDKPGCYEYLVFETLNNRVAHDYWNVPDACEFTPFWNHYGEYVTHWMPLPAAPQEVK